MSKLIHDMLKPPSVVPKVCSSLLDKVSKIGALKTPKGVLSVSVNQDET